MIVEQNKLQTIEEQIRWSLDAIRSQNGRGGSDRFFIVSRHIEPVSLLSWLKHQESLPGVYWHGRERDIEFAGCGAATIFSFDGKDDVEAVYRRIETVLNQSLSHPYLRFWGGARFQHRRKNAPEWNAFPTVWFVLPRSFLTREGNHYQAHVCLRFDIEKEVQQYVKEAAYWLEQTIPLDGSNSRFDAIPFDSRRDIPDFDGWSDNIHTALRMISAGEIEKIVLARKTDFRFSSPPDWARILSVLKERNQNCFSFLFRPTADSVFMGATPERLFHVVSGKLVSEAVSGTIRRGDSPQEDDKLAQMLLNSDKNRREHAFVVDAIKNMFGQLCVQVELQPMPGLLRLANVQHLYTRIFGRLKPKSGVSRIISIMHPTPAVGGTPRERAVNVIPELEPFDRGWYASPVGYIGVDQAEFVVALRSMLVRGSQISLYAGAGIVRGSDPVAEWEELDSKISLGERILKGELP